MNAFTVGIVFLAPSGLEIASEFAQVLQQSGDLIIASDGYFVNLGPCLIQNVTALAVSSVAPVSAPAPPAASLSPLQGAQVCLNLVFIGFASARRLCTNLVVIISCNTASYNGSLLNNGHETRFKSTAVGAVPTNMTFGAIESNRELYEELTWLADTWQQFQLKWQRTGSGQLHGLDRRGCSSHLCSDCSCHSVL